MRKIAILIFIFVCVVAVAVQMLPGDGARVTVYGIEAEIAESPEGLCDLSGAEVTGATELRFEHYGDSLVRCIAGMRADWLRISADTIWSVGSDTRRANIRYGHGVPYLLPCLSADGGDSLHHSVFLTIDRDSHIACRYSSRRGGGFILPGGDTIASTYCVETVMSDSAATVSQRRWYAEGALWPVVEQTTAKAGDEEWKAVTICPIGEQPRQRAAARGKSGSTKPTGGSAGSGIYDMLAQLHSSDPAPAHPADPICEPTFDYTIDRDGIALTGFDSGEAIVRLFDAAGRQWHEASATAPIPTAKLPSGVYLLQITSLSSPTTNQTIKVTIKGR